MQEGVHHLGHVGVGVGWVMKWWGWGVSHRGGVGHVGVGHEGVGWGGS